MHKIVQTSVTYVHCIQFVSWHLEKLSPLHRWPVLDTVSHNEYLDFKWWNCTTFPFFSWLYTLPSKTLVNQGFIPSTFFSLKSGTFRYQKLKSAGSATLWEETSGSGYLSLLRTDSIDGNSQCLYRYPTRDFFPVLLARVYIQWM